MTRFLALVWREIVEWRLVLLGGLLIGWMPWMVSWVPAFGRHDPDELREGVAILSSGIFITGFLVVLGSSILGRELSEGRLRFYFARPFSAGVLWAAKLTAAFLLLFVTLILLLLPSFDLVSGPISEVLTSDRDPAVPLFVPTPDYYRAYSWQSLPQRVAPIWRFLGASWALFFALVAVHCFSSMVRLRSVWIILDILGLALVTILGWWTLEHLLQEQALGPLVWLERALLVLVPLVLLGAGWHQLHQGRGDPAHSHRWLSFALWPPLLMLFLCVVGWAHWVTSDTLEDLERLTFVETAPEGPWMMVGGTTRDRMGKTSAFLFNGETGQSQRLGGLDVTAWQLAFSGNGQRVVWGQCASQNLKDCSLRTLDLGSNQGIPTRTGISLQHYWATLSLNHTGTRLALYQHHSLAIYELPSGQLVNALRTNEVRASVFLEDGRVRLYVGEETEDLKFQIKIREFDPESGAVETTGTLPDGIVGYHAHPTFEADTVLYWSHVPPQFAIANGRTGEDLKVFRRKPPRAALLTDGTSVLAFHNEESLELLILSPSAELLHSRTEEGIERVLIGGELAPGRVVIGLKSQGSSGEVSPALQGLDIEPLQGWTSFVLETSTGDLVELSGGVAPLKQTKFFQRLRPRAPESVLGRLFAAGQNTVLFWDPDTGEARRLLGPSL